MGLLVSPGSWASLDNDFIDSDLIAERLAAHAPQCGRFEQSRWLADLDTQLNSQGYFEQTTNQLVWQTTAPVQDRVLLSEANDDLPLGLQVIAPALTGLLSGDWRALERLFTIELSGAPEAWQARLTPKEASVAERLTQLQVHGTQHVEQVELEFANADRLTLILTATPCDVLESADALP